MATQYINDPQTFIIVVTATVHVHINVGRLCKISEHEQGAVKHYLNCNVVIEWPMETHCMITFLSILHDSFQIGNYWFMAKARAHAAS